MPDPTESPRRLNLGCNTDVRPGWVNVDIADYAATRSSISTPDRGRGMTTGSRRSSPPMCSSTWTTSTRWSTSCGAFSRPGGLIEVRVPFFLSTKFYSEARPTGSPSGSAASTNYEWLEGRKLKFYEQWKLTGGPTNQSAARFTVESKRFHFSNFAVLRWLNCDQHQPVIFERFFATLLTPEEVLFRCGSSRSRKDLPR